MMFRYLVLFLLPLAMRGENVSSWGMLRLKNTVVSPYRMAFDLLNTDIVNKLMNVNLKHVNHSLSNLAYELRCTVEEIQRNLKQTTLANQIVIRQIDVHVDQLLDSILRLENETIEAKNVMHELNNTVENAREQVRLAEIAEESMKKRFTDLIQYSSTLSEKSCESHRARYFWTNAFDDFHFRHDPCYAYAYKDDSKPLL
jgi:methyl-accepting chemotaxis protein